MAMIVSICNNKGGIGKTSSCQIFGEYLALIGKRVLLVDGDHSCSLTRLYFQEGTEIPSMDLWDLIGNTSTKKSESIAEFITETYLQNLYLLPGSDKFEDLEKNSIPQDALYKSLRDPIIADNFDYVIIDSHPSREEFTKIIVKAGDKIIIPMFADMLSFAGVSTMVNWIKDKCHREVDNILVSMYDNTKSAFVILYSVQGMAGLGQKLCKAIIPRANIIESWKFINESVVWKKPKHKAIEQYACAAFEIFGLGTENEAKKTLVDVAEKRKAEISVNRMVNLQKAKLKLAEKKDGQI